MSKEHLTAFPHIVMYSIGFISKVTQTIKVLAQVIKRTHRATHHAAVLQHDNTFTVTSGTMILIMIMIQVEVEKPVHPLDYIHTMIHNQN